MSGYIDTYCAECDEPVRAEVIERNGELAVKGEAVAYTEKIPVCPRCGAEIGDSRTSQENFEAAYAAYCSAHEIVYKPDIVELRRRMGLSVREFSRFLGFGEQTAARYESGSIPDELHSNTIKLASNPQGAAMLLTMNGRNMTEASRRMVEEYVKRLETGEEADSIWERMYGGGFPVGPNEFNGYRQADGVRIGALVSIIADKCRDLYKTKLQKAMFFCDFYAFEVTGLSLTGMSYAHADYGPVMENYDECLRKLESQGVIEIVPKGDWGEVIEPASRHASPFNDSETEMISDVCKFVNTFSTAGEISSYSHLLGAWRGTTSGQRISYQACKDEIAKAIESRLEKAS